MQYLEDEATPGSIARLFDILLAVLLIFASAKIYSSAIAALYYEKIEIILLSIIALCLFRLKLSKRHFSSWAFFFPVFLMMLAVVAAPLEAVFKYSLYGIFFLFLPTVISFRLLKYFAWGWLLIFLVSFVAYLCVVIFGLETRAELSGRFLAPNSSLITREDWQYSFQYLGVIFPLNYQADGIFNLPRFFGLSAEPSLSACLIVVLIHLMTLMRERLAVLLLLALLLFTSSFFSLIAGALLYILWRFGIFGFLAILCVMQYFYLGTYINSVRVESYLSMISVLPTFSWLPQSTNEAVSLQFPYGLLSFGYIYGLLPIILYFAWIGYIMKNNFGRGFLGSTDFYFFIFSLLVFNKAGEPVSVLFLIYVSALPLFLGRRSVYDSTRQGFQ